MGSQAWGALERARIEQQLERILASSAFRQSRRRSQLLRWSVERVLGGNTEPAKEHEIGIAVFGRAESWDPRIDPIVRVEFNRIRQKLREYYATDGAADPVIVEFPSRGYVPALKAREAAAMATPDVLEEEPPAPARARPSWRLAMGLAAIVVLLCTGVVLVSAMRFPGAHPPVTSIAVLPFLDLSPEHQSEYLTDGITDELTNALAMVHGLTVVARTSAFQFKGKGADVREIGHSLQVGTIVEGSVLRDGTHLRVIVQLDRTADGAHLWQTQYDRDFKDLLAVEDEITRSVADALQLRLTGAETAPDFDPGEQALNEYLQGHYAADRETVASFHAAVAHYDEAIRQAPGYALAYAARGSAHVSLAALGGTAQQSELELARGDLERAVALDDRIGAAHAALANIRYVQEWDWPRAEAEYRKALATAPSAATRMWYAWCLMTRGRFAEADEQYRQAIQLSPLDRRIHYHVALLLAESGRAASVPAELRVWLERDPKWFAGRLIAGYAAIYARHPAEALDHLRVAREIAPGGPMVEPAVSAAYLEQGRRTEALDMIRQIESRASQAGYVRYHLAIVRAILGDADGTFRWLEESAQAHEEQILYLRIDPMLAAYQHDPRMVALERRIGLIP